MLLIEAMVSVVDVVVIEQPTLQDVLLENCCAQQEGVKYFFLILEYAKEGKSWSSCYKI
jgi:hypothetical protein